ncbi:hypothetical protein Goklo_023939, partial [Gossypium klotzschianum]|nr:hypothetical protein [Gossypium klotzschianum]
WAAKGLLQQGLCWRVGRGDKISIWEDSWIPGIDRAERQSSSHIGEIQLVSDLIDNSNRKWREDLIFNTFQVETAQKILQMPLAETEHEDIQVWKGELSGEFFVRSAYKLLQEATLNPTDYLLQTESKNFYRKLWGLQLLPKITMTIWRISWDYIPNFVNLRCRKVITNEECPRYRSWPEESLYVFRDCPITKEIWISLDLFWVMDNTSQSYWEWLTWVFQKGNDAQCRLFCYVLWAI